MSGNLEHWIATQRSAIVANWREWDVPPAVAIEGTHVLGPNYGGPEGRASHWSPLAGAKPGIAAVQRTGSVVSLWITPASDSYVDLFRTFLSSVCDIDDSRLTTDYDVDHMYNRERARNFGYGFVRMFPILKSANRSHGAGYEKAITSADSGRKRKVMKLMDEVSTMKFFGIASPSSRRALTPVQQAHLGNMASTFGLSIEEIETGVSNLMGRAQGR